VLEHAHEPAATAAPERAAASPSPVSLPQHVLALQRTAGNAAVARMLAERGVQRWDWPWERSTPTPPPPDASKPDASSPDAGDGETYAPDNPSIEQDPAKPIGVCGPDVTKQLASTLGKIETDYQGWPKPDKRAACVRVMNPIDLEKLKASGLAGGDYNGWDTYALFSSYADWLRRPPVCGPCATPSSSAAPGASWKDKGHEDPRTCSNTVQVGNACWLAGTVNYATFGQMVRLCSETFTGDPDVAGDYPLDHAQNLIKAYKMFVSKENPKWPLEWTEAVYRGGSKATVPVGNRAGCSTTCSKVNPKVNPASLASWDYVWEPVKPRQARPPILPAPAPSAAP
jgi:hypothetical protein